MKCILAVTRDQDLPVTFAVVYRDIIRIDRAFTFALNEQRSQTFPLSFRKTFKSVVSNVGVDEFPPVALEEAAIEDVRVDDVVSAQEALGAIVVDVELVIAFTLVQTNFSIVAVSWTEEGGARTAISTPECESSLARTRSCVRCAGPAPPYEVNGDDLGVGTGEAPPGQLVPPADADLTFPAVIGHNQLALTFTHFISEAVANVIVRTADVECSRTTVILLINAIPVHI